MLNSKDTGGPAFPQDVGWVSPNSHVEYRGPQGGMTLRDYFAAKAMQSIIDGKTASQLLGGGYMATAMSSYAMADAMLKAREQ